MKLKTTFRRFLFVVAVVSTFACVAYPVAADDWPQFRGPGGQGHVTERGLPLRWSETENVIWKTAIPGRGWSSPVVMGDQIWMTAAVEQPASEEYRKKIIEAAISPAGLEVAGSVTTYAVCVDRRNGKLLHNIELFVVDQPQPIHQLNSYASPSPVIEAGRLYCHFGTYGTVCVDTESGKLLWKNQSLKFDHQNGPGASPVVWRNLLIVHCDGMDVQYITALDKRTGKPIWKTNRTGKMHDRPPFKKAYCTPLIIEDENRTQLISVAADWVYSYDPATGKELWKAGYGKLGFSNVARPVVGHGMVYICTSFMSSSMLAIRYDGSGDVTDSHIVWREDKQMPKMPSPILVGDEIYAVSDNGIATCLDAKTGKVHWRKRLGGNYSASPMLVDGRIYFFNREGETTVIKPGTEFETLAVNRLEGRFMASAAVVNKAFFLRTDKHLYRIQSEAAGK